MSVATKLKVKEVIMESILTSIKLMHGIPAECKDFDGPLIMHINTVLMSLKQLGVGPSQGFMIKSDMETWENFLGYTMIPSTAALSTEDQIYVEAAKTYVYLKVKMVFDPPTNAALIEAMNNQATELEWRLTVETNN